MAQNQAALRIEAFEATPKRRMGEAVLDLGGPVRVVDAIAAVLRVMVAEACRVKGGSRPEVVCLTHPATWAATRLAALREAAAVAGMREVVLLAEPVAAACWYTATSGRVPAGGRVAVYDLGGGTFDAAVVESAGDGSFVTVGRPLGVDPLGGVDFDHALLGLVGQTIERRDPQLWGSLQRPVDTRWRRRRRALLEQVSLLKEDLSTVSQSTLLVPETDLEVTVTREQFAALIRPEVERSAQVLLDTIAAAQMRPEELAAVYLVGGSSRIPTNAAPPPSAPPPSVPWPAHVPLPPVTPRPASVNTRVVALVLTGGGSVVLVLAYLALPWLQTSGEPSSGVLNISGGDRFKEVNATFRLVLMSAFVVSITLAAIACLRRAPHRSLPILTIGSAALAIAATLGGTLATRNHLANRESVDVSFQAGPWVAVIALLTLGVAGLLRMLR